MTRALIGTDPDQVPRNAFLGDLARMNSEELSAMVTNGITQKLSTTGLGAINDLRNTVFERGVPQDIFGTGMTTGLARAGADGIGIAGFANEEYGSLIVNGQWMDSSIGPAYNRIYFRNGRMWFQAMNTATSWGPWIEVATGMTALGKSLLTAADLAGALTTLNLLGLGNSTDLRYNSYEKGAPNAVANKGLAMGLARGGSDGLAIPALGSTTNQYGTLLVMAGYPDLSGGPAYNRMFIRNGRMFIQPYSSSTAWGTWTELAATTSIPAGIKTFETSQLTITSGGKMTIAHGLGAAPKLLNLQLVCVADALGFVAGERLLIAPHVLYDAPNSGNRMNIIHTLTFDATNVYVFFSNRFYLADKSTATTNIGESTYAVTNNFKLIVGAAA